MSAIHVPSATIDLTRITAGDLTLMMSFGLLNRLSAMVGDLNNLTDIYLVPELQDAILYELLVPRTDQGKPTVPYQMYQFSEGLSPEEGHRLLEWCEAHLTNFFMKRLQAAKALQSRMIKTMEG